MLNLFVWLTITGFAHRCHGYNLAVVLSEKVFPHKCADTFDSAVELDMEELLQLDLTHDFAEDMETLLTNGNITVLKDFPENTLTEMHSNVLKWNRGKWEDTIYSIRRSDFCTALFNPSELWYSVSEKIPPEERICPPKKGTVYHLKDVENRVELKNVNFAVEGQFKVVLRLKTITFMTCVGMIVDIWKN